PRRRSHHHHPSCVVVRDNDGNGTMTLALTHRQNNFSQSASARWPVTAGYGPSSRRVKPFSSSTGTPSSTARSCLEPGLSPATTYEVFFDTDPAALPPRAKMASLAPSRE